MEIFITISLGIITILLGYTTFNLLNKVEVYEDFIDKQIQNNEKLLETLRKIDNKQMFEKDDEVGSLFHQIKDTIVQFKQFDYAQKKTT